jgi:hypothetical protein
MPFEQYVRERILTPLEMTRTCLSSDEAHNRAIGHRHWFGWPVAYSGLPSSRIHFGAGGVYSSAEELAHFLIVQLNGGRYDGWAVLSPAGVAMLHRPAVEIQPRFHYALGWDARDTPNGLYVGHAGDSPDFHADLAMCPADRWGVVVLMNVNAPAATGEMVQLARDVLDLSRSRLVSPPTEANFVLRHICTILIALLCGQILLVVLFYRRVQRWRSVEEQRPRHWWRIWVWHSLVVVINLVLAYFLLVALPAAFEITLRLGLAFAPDSTWLVVFSSGFALMWSMIRTALVIQSYRAFGRPVVTTA